MKKKITDWLNALAIQISYEGSILNFKLTLSNFDFIAIISFYETYRFLWQ